MEKPWFSFYEDAVPHTIDYPHVTLHSMLDDTVGRFPDRAALVFGAAVGSRLLVTLGERGAALVEENGDLSIVPTPIVHAVDTTGAGDAFVGAFAFGLASGWAERDAVQLGCAIAAESVLRPGTQSSVPDAGRCAEIVAGVQARM